MRGVYPNCVGCMSQSSRCFTYRVSKPGRHGNLAEAIGALQHSEPKPTPTSTIASSMMARRNVQEALLQKPHAWLTLSGMVGLRLYRTCAGRINRQGFLRRNWQKASPAPRGSHTGPCNCGSGIFAARQSHSPLGCSITFWHSRQCMPWLASTLRL